MFKVHCIAFVCIMTCTLYTSQYRSRSNETSTCKYCQPGKQISIEIALKLLQPIEGYNYLLHFTVHGNVNTNYCRVSGFTSLGTTWIVLGITRY